MENARPTKPNKARSSLNSGLDVLECIADARRPLSLTEIATAVGMSKSSVHQLLATLQQRGYVRRFADQAYGLGIKAWEVGSLGVPSGLARIAEPHMVQLVREISDGVSLGVLDGCVMVCVQLVESARAVRVHSSIGDRTPAHCVSSGLALLSTMHDDEVSRILPADLEKITDVTLATREEVLAELKRIRARGYAFCRGAWRKEVGGASVPVIGPDGHAVASLCAAAPAFRTTREWVGRVVPALKATASMIERDLGRWGTSRSEPAAPGRTDQPNVAAHARGQHEKHSR